MSNDNSGKVEEPTVEWLIDQLAPGSSPLVDYNKQRLLELITNRVTEALEEVKLRSETHLEEDGRTERRAYLEDRIRALKEKKDA